MYASTYTESLNQWMAVTGNSIYLPQISCLPEASHQEVSAVPEDLTFDNEILSLHQESALESSRLETSIVIPSATENEEVEVRPIQLHYSYS